MSPVPAFATLLPVFKQKGEGPPFAVGFLECLLDAVGCFGRFPSPRNVAPCCFACSCETRHAQKLNHGYDAHKMYASAVPVRQNLMYIARLWFFSSRTPGTVTSNSMGPVSASSSSSKPWSNNCSGGRASCSRSSFSSNWSCCGCCPGPCWPSSCCCSSCCCCCCSRFGSCSSCGCRGGCS